MVHFPCLVVWTTSALAKDLTWLAPKLGVFAAAVQIIIISDPLIVGAGASPAFAGPTPVFHTIASGLSGIGA